MIAHGWLEGSNWDSKTAKKEYHISFLGVGVLSKSKRTAKEPPEMHQELRFLLPNGLQLGQLECKTDEFDLIPRSVLRPRADQTVELGINRQPHLGFGRCPS